MTSRIAAVVNLHNEGNSALPSLISAWRAVDAARVVDIDAELVLVLDRPDDATQAAAEAWIARGATIVMVDAGDLGEARNAAANSVDAEWLAFLDADDLWGEQWLVEAFCAATENPPRSTIDVWHPQVNIIFGDHHSLLHHVASTDPSFSWARFRLHNTWTALAMVKRSHLLALPYPRNRLTDGFGFEDWSWNMEVLRRGGRHHVVPGTCHFIRRTNSESLLGRSQAALRSRYPVDDLVAHVADKKLPGMVTKPSTLTPTETGVPATHQLTKANLDDAVLGQIRTAATIEPAVTDTMHWSGPSRKLPQNFNTHVTSAQLVVEDLLLAQATTTYATVTDLCDAVPSLEALDSSDRARVVADLLLDPSTALIARGDGAMIHEALRAYPQLRTTTW